MEWHLCHRWMWSTHRVLLTIWTNYTRHLLTKQVSFNSTPTQSKKMSNKQIFLRANGRAAMIGFLVLCASYATTGNLIPGII